MSEQVSERDRKKVCCQTQVLIGCVRSTGILEPDRDVVLKLELVCSSWLHGEGRWSETKMGPVCVRVCKRESVCVKE